MSNLSSTSVIRQACDLISVGNIDEASSTIKTGYPFSPIVKSGRKYSPHTMTKIFVRDGFIDRYRGARLEFPPALRVLSTYLPLDFPYHKNGKMSEGHLAYWELFPTIDHVQPVARGGVDTEENWVCCSMLTNSIKSNWTLEQLGWTLAPPGNLNQWDGLIRWFIERIEYDHSLLESVYFKTWYSAARRVLNKVVI